LTEAGQLYYERIRHILDEVNELEEQLNELNDEPRGSLVIAAPTSYATRVLSPIVTAFCTAHSGLRVQLNLEDRLIDLIEAGVDVALRIGHLADSSMIARPIGEIPRYICVSPAYLDRHGKPEHPEDLLEHACLHYNNIGVRDEWQFSHSGDVTSLAVQGPFCSNNGDVLCQAAEQGLGVVMLPSFIVQDALAEGRLARILRAYEPPAFTLNALYPSREYVPAKTRLFLDYLVEQLRPRMQRNGV
jgi:DNA-binding transcriptional LysR family regulator